jgi:hypothetical protein
MHGHYNTTSLHVLKYKEAVAKRTWLREMSFTLAFGSDNIQFS